MSTRVYITGTSRTVHKSEECPVLLGRAKTWLEADLDDIQHPNLCKFCYPDAPSIKVLHRKCCGSMTLPCAHNGGVLVETARRLAYVWPEDAHQYTLVNAVPLD
jgi:hypothetical protein